MESQIEKYSRNKKLLVWLMQVLSKNLNWPLVDFYNKLGLLKSHGVFNEQGYNIYIT